LTKQVNSGKRRSGANRRTGLIIGCAKEEFVQLVNKSPNLSPIWHVISSASREIFCSTHGTECSNETITCYSLYYEATVISNHLTR